MNLRPKTLIALSLPFQVLLVRWLADHQDWVEAFYSRGIYPRIATIFHFIYGWIPFSVGDVCYFILGIGTLTYLIRRRHWIRTHPWTFFRDVIAVLAVVHFTFYLLWGMNYFRQPLSKTMAYAEAYTTEELMELTVSLARHTNKLQEEITGDTLSAVRVPYSKSEIMSNTVLGYRELQ
ncbi:MAG: DUF3810 family protein, partial [Robiginitalea sp.]